MPNIKRRSLFHRLKESWKKAGEGADHPYESQGKPVRLFYRKDGEVIDYYNKSISRDGGYLIDTTLTRRQMSGMVGTALGYFLGKPAADYVSKNLHIEIHSRPGGFGIDIILGDAENKFSITGGRNNEEWGPYSQLAPHKPKSEDLNTIVENYDLSQIRLGDMGTDVGKILRAKGWENIAQKVGEKYGVPSSFILALMCQESFGDILQVNGRNDGGAGPIHMQPKVARAYGLKLIDNSNEYVDYSHGIKLKEAIETYKEDLKILRRIDERFDPVAGIDAAVRFFCDVYLRDANPSADKALERFSNREHSDYGSKVRKYWELINEDLFIEKAKIAFKNLNRGTIISGKQITLEDYLKCRQEYNRNFGLDRYDSSPIVLR